MAKKKKGRRAARRGMKHVIIRRRGRKVAEFWAHTDGRKRSRRWSAVARKARGTIGAASRHCVRARKKPGTKPFGACIRKYMHEHGVKKAR